MNKQIGKQKSVSLIPKINDEYNQDEDFKIRKKVKILDSSANLIKNYNPAEKYLHNNQIIKSSPSARIPNDNTSSKAFSQTLYQQSINLYSSNTDIQNIVPSSQNIGQTWNQIRGSKTIHSNIIEHKNQSITNSIFKANLKSSPPMKNSFDIDKIDIFYQKKEETRKNSIETSKIFSSSEKKLGKSVESYIDQKTKKKPKKNLKNCDDIFQGTEFDPQYIQEQVIVEIDQRIIKRLNEIEIPIKSKSIPISLKIREYTAKHYLDTFLSLQINNSYQVIVRESGRIDNFNPHNLWAKSLDDIITNDNKAKVNLDKINIPDPRLKNRAKVF